jgi:hypothetical protein
VASHSASVGRAAAAIELTQLGTITMGLDQVDPQDLPFT